MRNVLLSCALLLGSASAAIAKPALTCTDPHYHDFDFWLGKWAVTGKNGKLAGHSVIEAAHGDCAVYEHWTNAQGGSGGSINYFDPGTRRWRQVYVDGVGDLIDMEGALVGGAMILEGPYTHADGSRTRLRGTWSKNADGTVRQLFEESKDGGVTWAVWFDGSYAKQK